MQFVELDGLRLRCDVMEKAGAPALLLLHPLAANLAIWDPQIEVLRQHFTLVRFDARGHGESSPGPITEPTMKQLAKDAIAVLDGLGIERVHLCGLSIGGMVAMQAATSWPERVSKLILCATTPYMPSVEMWQERIDTVLRDGVAPLVDGILGRWFTPRFHAEAPGEVDRVRAMLLRTSAQGYAANAAAIRDMDQRESIRAISAETLVIAGAHDPGVPPATAEALAKAIPNARLSILDSAHLPNVEQRTEFNSTVLEFLRD
jgi:3-oxoadipate enol-lactonase